MVRYLVPLGVFVVLVGFLAAGLGIDPSRVPSPFIDKPIPAFSMSLLNEPGSELTDETLRGQVSMLNVWASWCPGCRDEHELLVMMADTIDVPIYGLNYKDQIPDAKRWLQQFGNPYEAIGFDGEGRVAIDWGVYGAPETFVIDKQGHVRYKHIGPLTHEALRETVLPLIEQLRSEST